MNFKKSEFYLFLVAIIWGLTFPVIEMAVGSTDPYLFVALRFSVAAIFFLPFALTKFKIEYLGWAIILGIANYLGFTCQTVGLQEVNASRAAFLTSTYVLMIPLLSPFFRMGAIQIRNLVGGAICLAGVFILTGCRLGTFCAGDLSVLFGAFVIAITILYIGKLSRSNIDPMILACFQIIMTAIISWGPALYFTDLDFQSFFHFEPLIALLVCSFLATIFSMYIESKHLGGVSVHKAALILSTEPLFATLFESLISKTLPNWNTILGGGVILLSIVYLEFQKTPEESQKIA